MTIVTTRCKIDEWILWNKKAKMSPKKLFNNFYSFLQKFSLKQDLVAGLTVSIVSISSAMAYAAIAGVNPIHGLYAAIFPAIVGSLFGSSKVLITGPTNATALVTASILIGLGVDDKQYVEMVFALAILSGLMRLFFGLINFGSFIKFISNSVLTGFLAGVGILIAIGQLGNLTGLMIPKNEGVFGIIQNLYNSFSNVNLTVMGTGVVSILLILVIKKAFPKIPAAFVAIVTVSLIVQLINYDEAGVRLVSDLNIPKNPGLNFHIPKVKSEEIISLIPGALALSIFTLIEAASTSKMFSGSNEKPLNISKEFCAQGLASIVGGFFMAIPSSGSPSRTAINYSSGAKSRLSGVSSGIFLFLFLLLFSKWIGFIALPSLAAAILVSGLRLIKVDQIRILWNYRTESKIVFLGTFFATMFFPLHYSIYFGIGISVILHLLEGSEVHLSYLVSSLGGQIIEKSLEQLVEESPEIAVVNIQEGLSFSQVEGLEEKILPILEQKIRVVILRVRRVKIIGSTGIIAIKRIILYAKKNNIQIIICGIQPDVRKNLEMAGIEKLLNRENIFDASEVVYDSMKSAIHCAEQRLLTMREI